MANPLAPRYGAIDGHLAAVAIVDALSFRNLAIPEIYDSSARNIAQ